jgi:hypothetical protein
MYEGAGTWPADAVPIDDWIFEEFIQTPPEGKQRGVLDMMPAWVDRPQVVQTMAMLETAVRSALDVGAASWDYQGIDSACSWTSSTVPQKQAEALALSAWRDACYVWVSSQDPAVANVAQMPTQPQRPTTP